MAKLHPVPEDGKAGWTYCSIKRCKCNLPKLCVRYQCNCCMTKGCDSHTCKCDALKVCYVPKCDCGRPKIVTAGPNDKLEEEYSTWITGLLEIGKFLGWLLLQAFQGINKFHAIPYGAKNQWSFCGIHECMCNLPKRCTADPKERCDFEKICIGGSNCKCGLSLWEKACDDPMCPCSLPKIATEKYCKPIDPKPFHLHYCPKCKSYVRPEVLSCPSCRQGLEPCCEFRSEKYK